MRLVRYHGNVITEGWAAYLTGPWGIFFAMAAGVISFLSPCVLPLVPVYLAHLTGVSSDPNVTAGRRETLTHALAFVSGFGLIFTAIGASAGLAGSLVRDELPTLEKIAGAFLVVLGFNLMGVIKLPWFYRTYQLATPSARAPAAVVASSTPLSYARSLGLGSSFAVAWTPCIGPVLGAIFTLAAASSTVHQGTYLLLAYSAGLAIPFLVAGLALGSLTGFIRRIGRFLPALELGTGAVVALVGILVFTNQFTSLNQYFNFIEELNAV